ncbi:hypothetical protein R3P38DRAFT_855942 [Favolaschia claudopus]|uniref:Secreted protein n=1 Tax=Favolaschia claudopus TaxID=2862362 RepID=A0AAW0BUD5_9AGAR
MWCRFISLVYLIPLVMSKLRPYLLEGGSSCSCSAGSAMIQAQPKHSSCSGICFLQISRFKPRSRPCSSRSLIHWVRRSAQSRMVHPNPTETNEIRFQDQQQNTRVSALLSMASIFPSPVFV